MKKELLIAINLIAGAGGHSSYGQDNDEHHSNLPKGIANYDYADIGTSLDNDSPTKLLQQMQTELIHLLVQHRIYSQSGAEKYVSTLDLQELQELLILFYNFEIRESIGATIPFRPGK